MKILIFGLYDFKTVMHFQVRPSPIAFLVLFGEKKKNKSSNTGLVIDAATRTV
jgi:hypothetical protein